MKSFGRRLLVPGICALSMLALCAGTAVAQQNPSTPRGWNYQLRDGRRVPKTDNRVTNPDGSWREEQRQGHCVTIKEMSKNGEYKETRQCNPN